MQFQCANNIDSIIYIYFGFSFRTLDLGEKNFALVKFFFLHLAKPLMSTIDTSLVEVKQASIIDYCQYADKYTDYTSGRSVATKVIEENRTDKSADVKAVLTIPQYMRPFDLRSEPL